ncbi:MULTISPECIES: acyl carrier protein [Bacillaceae]|uniref:acyl carrier protein n=1 Tax=Bacillaceae TaxID=186817 RepID=UPI00207B006C|nr:MULTISPECIES: acyl carrier protein [Bacillaceae]MED3994636.1 acyl carrier protein [Peribacillus frigoritolerans]USL11092.1 acyl carrier protein [Bacillus bombysepticus]
MKEKINEIMLQIGFETLDLNEQFSLIDDLGIDSTELVELAFHIKKKFDITLTLEELKTLNTLKDLYQVVEREALHKEDFYAKNKK